MSQSKTSTLVSSRRRLVVDHRTGRLHAGDLVANPRVFVPRVLAAHPHVDATPPQYFAEPLRHAVAPYHLPASRAFVRFQEIYKISAPGKA